MSPPWNAFVEGAVVGGSLGLLAGYQVRVVVVLIHDWRVARRKKRSKVITKRDLKVAYEHDKTVGIVKYGPGQRMLQPDVIPITRGIKHFDNPVKSSQRDDVISALVGLGYNKTLATKAVDTCMSDERSSVERWTMAALRNAAGAK